MPLHYHFLPVLGSESETHSTIVFVFGLEKTPTDFNEKAPPFIHSANVLVARKAQLAKNYRNQDEA